MYDVYYICKIFHILKMRRVLPEYFSEILDVWEGGQTLSWVFHTSSQRNLKSRRKRRNEIVKMSVNYDQGPVTRKSRKPFGPAKQIVSKNRCIRLKLFVWREPLFIHMWIKQLCNHQVWDFATAFRVRKRFGTFEKRATDNRNTVTVMVCFVSTWWIIKEFEKEGSK